MNEIEVTKWVCIDIRTVHSNCFSDYINKKALTIGKVYDLTKETAYDLDSDICLSYTSFTGDDGQSYLFDNDEINFITLKDYRGQQIDKIL